MNKYTCIAFRFLCIAMIHFPIFLQYVLHSVVHLLSLIVPSFFKRRDISGCTCFLTSQTWHPFFAMAYQPYLPTILSLFIYSHLVYRVAHILGYPYLPSITFNVKFCQNSARSLLTTYGNFML